MKLNTMAAVMTFVTQLETDAAAFYETRAAGQPELGALLQTWARENRKFEKQVKQTYFGVITDTLESNYSFQGLDTDSFSLNMAIPDDADAGTMKNSALALEENIQAFYLEAARLSEGLMADIPRLFRKIAKKREERCQELRP